MKNRFKLAAGLVHAILVLALIIPLIYNIFLRQEDTVRRKLYGISLLIAVPVIVTGIAFRTCRSLWTYLAVCSVMLAGTGICAWYLGAAVLTENLKWGYLIILMLESLFVVIQRFTARIRKERENREDYEEFEDFEQWQGKWKGVLEKPRAGFLCYFLAVYLIGQGCSNAILCNEALGSTILYLFITVPYYFLESMEEYLLLRKRVCNLPSRRIYGISKGVLFSLLAGIAVFALLSVFTGKYRRYIDIRNIGIGNEINYELVEELWLPEINFGNEEWGSAMEGSEVPEAVSVLFRTVFNLIGIAIIVVLIVAAIRSIHKVFGKFRESYDENGDLVETLEDEIGVITRSGFLFREREPKSERERIRYHYRKVIRKSRKESPAPCETPLEIETAAQIADSEEGKTLHRQYEEARYGR